MIFPSTITPWLTGCRIETAGLNAYSVAEDIPRQFRRAAELAGA